MIDLMSQKDKIKSEREQQEKQLSQFIEYQKSVQGLEDSDDDLAGRSVT